MLDVEHSDGGDYSMKSDTCMHGQRFQIFESVIISHRRIHSSVRINKNKNIRTSAIKQTTNVFYS